ncbi:uncharacterized protein LOC111690364 [Lucilia cuprina]|uniref:uncharacterized protein LOC111690364 n=1 Tax=Lucilia cuprina TaxID=7375 RepID=UPI001F063532|nr:uncharacterized protein LOC111690364 [Lucilia cuprina]
MPKRVLKHHLEKAAKCRRKSVYVEDTSRISGNIENEDEDKPNDPDKKPIKHMQYLRTNQNNEVERLLLHNAKGLLFHVDHCDFPAFNVGMWPQENIDMLTNYPQCAFNPPRPIFVADKMCEKNDLCYRRPMNFEFYNIRMRHSRTRYKTALKSNKAIRSSSKYGFYHSTLFDIAERFYLNPDQYFQSSYDYYYTGGNLNHLANKEHVVHAGGEQLRKMMVSEFPDVQENNDTYSLKNIASQKLNENCEIFEVQPLLTSHDSSRSNCYIARQRNLITFNYLNDNRQIKTVTQFRTKTTPFISFAQSQHNINKFVITTMKQHVRLYDLNTTAPALVKLYEIAPKSTDISWNTIKPWRENTFMYANQKQFFMIDIRTSPDQWLSDVTAATDSFMCDHISALLPSDFNNLFYVATNHKLQCMDIRHLKKFSFSETYGSICRWSHQLRYAPLMMDTLRIRQNEYIALSSPIAGDLHICQLSRERNEEEINLEISVPAPKHIYSSSCLPYQPPTLLESYEHARISGKCLRPEANLEARLKCCTTGLKFIRKSLNNTETGIGLLLTSNSNGDIFAHTLCKRENMDTEERCNRQSDEIMDKFEKQIFAQTKLPLNYTEIKEMKGLRKILLCQTLSSVKKFDIDAMENEYTADAPARTNNQTNPPAQPRSKRLHLGRWQKSLSTLHSYKDALVKDLLSIWDIDMEEEKHIRLGNLRNIKPDPAVKVENWLKTNINPNPPPMIAIPQTQDFSRYTENIDDGMFNITQTQDNTIDFENVIQSTQIMDTSDINLTKTFDRSSLEIRINNETTTTVVEKLKSKKKNKKYVKGF